MAKKRHTGNQGFIDEAILVALRSGVKGFASLPFPDQFNLAELILSCDDKRRKHKRYEDALAFTYQELNRRFSRGRFTAINEKLEIFLSSENWQSEHNECRAYWLTHKVRKIRDKYLKRAYKHRQGRFIYENNTFMRTPPKAIAAKDVDDHTAKNNTEWQIQALTPVNTENLKMYADALEKQIQNLSGQLGMQDLFMPQNPELVISKTQKLLNKLRLMAIWVQTDIGGGKYLLHRYTEHKTGRLYASGSVNLQNTPREIRQTALQGCYDYDIENCHYSLFYQLADRAGCPTPHIEHYLANKGQVRQEIAKATGQHISLVKQCLLAMIYGAGRTEYRKAAIPQILGDQSAKAFFALPLVDGLYEELKAGRAAIVKHCKKSRGRIRNQMGRFIAANEQEKKILAHLLQGIEAKIMEIARELYGEQIILLQHDGFTCPVKIDYRKLEKEVQARLGYSIEMSEELLQIPSHLVADENIIPNREMEFMYLESIAYDDSDLFTVS